MSSQNQTSSVSLKPPSNEQLHDVDTIARRLNVSTKTLRRLIRQGELGFYQVGRLVRISEAQYEEYLASAQHRHRL